MLAYRYMYSVLFTIISCDFLSSIILRPISSFSVVQCVMSKSWDWVLGRGYHQMPQISHSFLGSTWWNWVFLMSPMFECWHSLTTKRCVINWSLLLATHNTSTTIGLIHFNWFVHTVVANQHRNSYLSYTEWKYCTLYYLVASKHNC